MTDRSVRGDGDNLFTNPVIAIDPETGRRQWQYQFTPNDGHDWDSTDDLVLVIACGEASIASC
jgi:alcohol dehydrogenase (cytochrome c)